jgi:hypothetical protein
MERPVDTGVDAIGRIRSLPEDPREKQAAALALNPTDKYADAGEPTGEDILGPDLGFRQILETDTSEHTDTGKDQATEADTDGAEREPDPVAAAAGSAAMHDQAERPEQQRDEQPPADPTLVTGDNGSGDSGGNDDRTPRPAADGPEPKPDKEVDKLKPEKPAPRHITHQEVHEQPIGAPLELVPPEAPPPKDLPRQIREAVEPVLEETRGPLYPEQDRRKLSEDVDAVALLGTAVALEQPAPERLSALANDTDPAAAAARIPNEAVLARLADDGANPGAPNDPPIKNSPALNRATRFAEQLKTATADEVVAGFTLPESEFSQALSEVDERALLERVTNVEGADKSFWQSLRGDPLWYSQLYNMQGAPERRILPAEHDRVKNEKERILTMRKQYYDAKARGANPPELVDMLEGFVEQSNQLDADALRHMYEGGSVDATFLNQTPHPYSPLAEARWEMFMGPAYSNLVRTDVDGRKLAEQRLIDIQDKILAAQAQARQVNNFYQNPYAAQTGDGSDHPSEAWIKAKAMKTALQVKFELQFGENPEQDAGTALVQAYKDVAEKHVEKWQTAAWAGEGEGNRNAYLQRGERPSMPPGHWDRMKELEVLFYSLVIGQNVEDEVVSADTADQSLLSGMKTIVDGRQAERDRLLMNEDRQAWLSGDRPGPSEEVIRDLVDYTTLLVSTTARSAGREAAVEKLQEMFALVADAEIRSLEAQQHQADPSQLQQGRLPKPTAEILEIRVRRAEQIVQDLLQQQGKGAAVQFVNEWVTVMRKELEGRRLLAEFDENPQVFMNSVSDQGMRQEELTSLPTSVIAIMLEDTAKKIGELGEQGKAPAADSPMYQWFMRLNGILQSREFDRSGQTEQERLEAGRNIAAKTTKGVVGSPTNRNRVNIISSGRRHPDPLVVATGTNPNVSLVTTLENETSPELVRVTVGVEQGRKHAVNITNRGDISPDATARVNIINGPAPMNVNGAVLLGGMAPGDVAFYTQEENGVLDRQVRELLENPKYGWQYVMRTSPSGLISLEPFKYTPTPNTTTVMLFRDELGAQPNRVLIELMRRSDQLAERRAARQLRLQQRQAAGFN